MPAQTQPRLTDAASLAARRARARMDKAGFLHEDALFELQERLQDVNRTFTAPAIVTAFPELWVKLTPGARIVPPHELLDLEASAHDLVVHAMALHWADDPVGQIVQCRRALRPDGLFLAVSFGGDTLVELRGALAEAEAEVLGGISPRVAPMAEIRDMGALLQRAGLALPVADALRRRVTYRDALALMRDLRAMGETNALADRHRAIPPRTLFARAAEIYAHRHPAEENRIQATFEFVFLTGWAPHGSQQQPLRPGTATSRLADALNVPEFPAPSDATFDEASNPVHDRPDDESPDSK